MNNQKKQKTKLILIINLKIIFNKYQNKKVKDNQILIFNNKIF